MHISGILATFLTCSGAALAIMIPGPDTPLPAIMNKRPDDIHTFTVTHYAFPTAYVCPKTITISHAITDCHGSRTAKLVTKTLPHPKYPGILTPTATVVLHSTQCPSAVATIRHYIDCRK
ncbi:hypothetical protein TWF696_000207 [Orbilia brochopaga]|uniref:Uncharacterized protein n=1 Tax=Orbilia brochopaga TaxID=3140254 RepID=A0AAV9VD29_9PEZI